MDTLIKARQLADYVALHWRLPETSSEVPAPASDNLGAILVDAVFQAGLNYRTVVLPRVCAVAQAFPALDSLRKLEATLGTKAFSSAINWRHPEKPTRLRELVGYFRGQGLETLLDLRSWLSSSANRVALLSVRGIGHKTVDYLSKLLGLPAIAVDRHARRLLRDAGIVSRGYLEAKRILEFAADLLRISRWAFDRLMWQILSGQRSMLKIP